MGLSAGSKLGSYQIVTLIGAGGMGEVYRARDTKLGREVAIKVLSEEFSKDRERLARFEREARLLAQLNHPNVATLHGLEESDGRKFLVMELVEGETFAERIARGAIPLDEAVSLFAATADGLEAAHEKGIIHRDLKPANLKIGLDGNPKILDFGLAKAFAAEQHEVAATSQSPTLTKGTALGVIMGTASYMSPEQARGKPVDKRTDIWAYGCCVYEALTGTKPFDGDNITDVLAAVVRAEPNWDALPDATPPHVRQLLHRCLTKDVRERLRDIGEARIGWGRSGDTAEPWSVRHPPRRPTVGLLGLGLVFVAATLAVVLVSRTTETTDERPAITFPISSTASLQIETGDTTPFAISPDGTTIVLQAVAPPETDQRLWVRTLNDPKPRSLDGTVNGSQPMFSPDGQWIAFVADNRTIKKVSADGGPVTTLATLEYNTAALSWLSGDEILTETLGPKGIQILSAHGGTPEVVIPLDAEASEFRQRRPFVLHNLRMVLYASTIGTGRTELAMFSIDDGRRARLGVEGIQALGIVDERLVYVRDDGVLMAVPFDAKRMRTTGGPVQLLEQVASTISGVQVVLSNSGTLVYEAPRNRDSRLSLLDTSDVSARITFLGPDSRTFREPRFSPDGSRVAVAVATGPAFDLWIYDGAFTSPRRMTRSSDASGHRWMPDGKSLIYAAPDVDDTTRLWSLTVDGSNEPTRVDRAGEWVREAETTPDGNTLVVRRVEPHAENLAELTAMSLTEDSAPISLVTWPSWPLAFRLSPDGQRLAYVDRRPVDRLMVMTLDGESRVFVADGSQPIWAPDSQSLFYRSGEQLLEAELTFSPTLEVVRRITVIEGLGEVLLSDVTPDGRSFLALTPAEREGGREILVSVNWASEKIREWRTR